MALLRAVQKSFQQIAPLSLSSSWDNTGTLVNVPLKANARTCVLCIDLTKAVLDEAPADTGVIVAYHPPIFSGLKSLSTQVPLQDCLIRCIQQGIAIYSPHTCLDQAVGGLNDFLADGLGPSSRQRITPKTGVQGHEGAGEGLVVSLDEAVSIDELVTRVKSHLGLKTVMLARGLPSQPIKSVAICAGSGASMLKDVQADAWLTGEASHHELLATVAKGTSVILCNHSNTERPFLQTLAPRLEKELNQVRTGEQLGSEPFQVVVSQADRDPLEFV